MDLQKCPFCGGDICHSGDFMANEIFDDYADDDDAIVSNYVCMRCGRDFEVMEPTLEQRNNEYAEYWKGNK